MLKLIRYFRWFFRPRGGGNAALAQVYLMSITDFFIFGLHNRGMAKIVSMGTAAREIRHLHAQMDALLDIIEKQNDIIVMQEAVRGIFDEQLRLYNRIMGKKTGWKLRREAALMACYRYMTGVRKSAPLPVYSDEEVLLFSGTMEDEIARRRGEIYDKQEQFKSEWLSPREVKAVIRRRVRGSGNGDGAVVQGAEGAA